MEGGGLLKLDPHPLRGAVLAEVHARPFKPIATPARMLHFAFLTDHAQAAEARLALVKFCNERGVDCPRENAKHFSVTLADAALRFEQHSEFTTYTWEVPSRTETPFDPPAATLATCMAALPQPGPHLVSTDIHLLPEQEGFDLASIFDTASLAASAVDSGRAVAATDFKPGSDGFVRMLVFDHNLTPPSAGALIQRLLEIETYRMLALMGLPETQAHAPSVRKVEDSLTRVARAMTETKGLAADHKLLDELTSLAAELEAGAAASAYRFGATRAYDNIVKQRLDTIGEMPFSGLPSIAQFLNRRMAPAMRTCLTLEERQANLSQKLARAANLLRTRVDVEIEQQNRDLLRSMNERTRLQLRLQQTVEGLSVAAVSYYIVGLIAYLFKGAKDAGYIQIEPGVTTALSVPVVLFFMWLIIRRIRRAHSPDAPAAN
ncbi:MAG: DUF3422 domain-containing protein [Beijerinckiaceae bacterium]|nr:DUF3422 domain-containing protein [Beijerinckiaceae bacterium]